MKAIARQVRISPKKANLIAALVRKKPVIEAVNILKFTPKKAAGILKKVIESAAANGVNNDNQKKDNLFIKEIIVTKGITFKRSVPISRGRAHPILKRNAHITVKLDTIEKTKKATPAKTTTKAEADNKTEEKPKKEAKKTPTVKVKDAKAKKTTKSKK